MHELETIAHRRDELDDQELAYLDEQSELAGEVARLDDDVPSWRRRPAAPAPPWRRPRRRSPRSWRRWPPAESSSSPASTPMRSSATSGCGSALGGVAVARSTGSRCSGCHLDLSRSELDDVKARRRGRVRRLPAVRPPARALTAERRVAPVVRGDGDRHVWFVFRDPRFDYRLLIVGSVLPLLDGVTGGAAGAPHLGVQPRAAGRGHAARRSVADRRASCCSGCRSARCCTSCSTVCGRTPTCSGGRSAGGASTTPRCRRWRGAGGTSPSSSSVRSILVWVWRASDLSDPAARRRFWQRGSAVLRARRQ